MDCKSVIKLLDELIDRYCDADTDARVTAHLATCHMCSGEYKKRLQLKTALNTFPVPSRTDADWQKIEYSILREIEHEKQRNRVVSFSVPVPLRVAAILVLILFASIPFIHNLTNNRHINSEVAFTMPQLIHAEGMVSLNGTIASELRKNQNIVIGSVIATESGAQVIIKADSGSNIALGEKSAVKVKAFSKKNQTFQLDYGTVSVHVAKRKDDQLFSVKTRNAVCEVVGTRFSVEFNGDSSKPSTVLFVKDGCVRFRTLDGNAVLVKSGEKCSINGTVMGEKAVLIRNDRLGEDFESKKSIETVIHNHDKRMIAEKRETDQSTLLPVSDYIRLMREADSLIDKEKFSEALQSIEKVVSSSVMKPDQFYDATMKKVRLMKRLQRYRDAAVLLENVAAGKFRKEYCGNALYQLAILQEKELKNSEKAIESLQKYISEYNDGVMISDAYYSLAVILHEKKDYKAEAIVYNQYIETFGNTESSQRAVYALASLYSKELHDCTRALGLFTHLEQSDPKGVYAEDALFWKANCLNAQGKANMAIAAYKEYLERYPDGRWVMDAKARTLTKNDPGGQKK